MKKYLFAVLAILGIAFVNVSSASAASVTDSADSIYSGYVKLADASTNGYEGVEETLTVPTPTKACSDFHPVHMWVGFDHYEIDQPGSNLTQIGFLLWPDGHADAWWWAFNKDGSEYGHQWLDHSIMDIHAGDSVTIREVWMPGHQNVWFVWNDHTTGQYYQLEKYLPGLYSRDVEWIVEPSASYDSNGKFSSDPQMYWNAMYATDAKATQVDFNTPLTNGVPNREGGAGNTTGEADYRLIYTDKYNNPSLVPHRSGTIDGNYSIDQVNCNVSGHTFTPLSSRVAK